MIWPCFKSSGLVNTDLQGTVKGKRQRGRQKNRWEDKTISKSGQEWTLPAENRTRWKGIVANTSLVPRRPAKVMT